MADAAHQSIIAGRYEELDAIIAELGGLSLDNSGGVYSKKLSEIELKQVRAIEVDPWARVTISVQYWADWKLKGDVLEVRRSIK